MPDWQRLVKARLGILGLGPRREAEVVVELADHLADLNAAGCLRGLSPEDAVARTLQEIPDWTELRREILRVEQEENDMTPRTKALWLPGLVTLTLAMGVLLPLERAGLRAQSAWLQPSVFWLRPPFYLVLYWPWLILLPAVGALGAFWSRSSGGRAWETVLSSVFPAVALTAMFVVIFPVALLVDPGSALVLKLTGLGVYLLNWTIIPGAALVLGALPFLKGALSQTKAG